MFHPCVSHAARGALATVSVAEASHTAPRARWEPESVVHTVRACGSGFYLTLLNAQRAFASRRRDTRAPSVFVALHWHWHYSVHRHRPGLWTRASTAHWVPCCFTSFAGFAMRWVYRSRQGQGPGGAGRGRRRHGRSWRISGARQPGPHQRSAGAEGRVNRAPACEHDVLATRRSRTSRSPRFVSCNAGSGAWERRNLRRYGRA